MLRHKTDTVATRLSVTLVESLWNLSLFECDEIVRSELDDPDIVAIVLRDEKKDVRIAMQRDNAGKIGYISPARIVELPALAFMERDAEIQKNDITIGSISVFSTNYGIQGELVARLLVILAASFAIVALIALGLFVIVDRLVSRRIVLLRRTMESFASGELGSRALVKYDDDLSRLAMAFNTMAQKIKILYDELSLSEEHYRGLFNGVPAGIYRMATDGRFIDANPALVNLLGCANRQALLGSSFDSFGTAMGAREAWLSYMRSDGAVKDFVQIIRRADGEMRWVRDNCRAVLAASGSIDYYEGSLEDITDIKKAEAEQKQLIDKLEQKNSELERFTYTVSHDLKSPLITIKGFLGYLNKEAREGDFEAFSKDLARIGTAADKMQALLLELLELSRIGRLQNPREEVGFTDLAKEAAAIVAGRLNERGVRTVIEEGMPVLYCDKPRLLEVVQNLIENAVKFMGKQSQPLIEIGSRTDQGKAVFYVRDNGIGIDPRYHERVFALFERLDTNTEGTGMGLSIAKRIIEVHGGKIWVESEGLGRGSAFCFSITDPRGAVQAEGG